MRLNLRSHRVGSCFFKIKTNFNIFSEKQPDSPLNIKIIEEKWPSYPKAHIMTRLQYYLPKLSRL